MTGLLLSGGCNKLFTRDAGFLEGKISIGPICPVEKDPPDPACLPTAETYKAYPVGVWTSGGRRKVAVLDPSPDGTYRSELDEGSYLIVLERDRSGIGASNLPVEVTVISESTTILNIEIDTGIR